MQEGLTRYAGVDDQYFLAAALPGGRQRAGHLPAADDQDAGRRSPDRRLPDPRRRRRAADVLPRARRSSTSCSAPTPELTRTIHLGIFGFLATPLLKALKWINEYVGNFGWSIILLTVLINLVIFPLRHKSAVSMRKMQQIQPQVKAIQDRYAKLKMTDPARQKMNQELMELYKAKGANPASGCLPMLLTFPVLFAFYAFLSQAIELRGAPWIGWIHDLSRARSLLRHARS